MQYQTCPRGRDCYKGVERFASGKLGSKEGGWISLSLKAMHEQTMDDWVGVLQAENVHEE